MQQFILSTYKLRVVLPLTREVVAKVLLSDPIQSFETFALGALYPTGHCQYSLSHPE